MDDGFMIFYFYLYSSKSADSMQFREFKIPTSPEPQHYHLISPYSRKHTTLSFQSIKTDFYQSLPNSPKNSNNIILTQIPGSIAQYNAETIPPIFLSYQRIINGKHIFDIALNHQYK